MRHPSARPLTVSFLVTLAALVLAPFGRTLLAAGPSAATNPLVAAAGSAAAASVYAPVLADKLLVFPEDFGSHSRFRTEWWYVTGWLSTDGGDALGFQITFFRAKPAVDDANPSAFTAHQLIIAHCAISDPKRGRLWQDQRIRRAGMGLADAAVGDTHVWIEKWSLQRDGKRYAANIDAEDFSLHLEMAETQAMLINGDGGFSRKGPDAQAASYYYSLPHLQVSGHIIREGRPSAVTGTAWFDHEWSSEYLDPQALGWDWVGINLDDGGALMAFRIRDAHGAQRWAGGTYRRPDGNVQLLKPEDVAFIPLRRWLSPRTGISYPVEWRLRAGALNLTLEPLMDDQENDTRFSTGAIYWEGAVQASADKNTVGRGYLELTGYGEKLKLR